MREWLIKPLGRFLASNRYLNPCFAPLFNGLVHVQIALITAGDRLRRRAPADHPLLDELTLVVKTFERRALLLRLLRSIRRTYPGIRIVVVDDSREPAVLEGADYVVLPFDSGVSAGRNAGLARVKTPYTMILDDDFVFYRNSDLLASLRKIAAEPRIDILGGIVFTLPMMELNDSSRTSIYKEGAKPSSTPLAGLEQRLKVPNFFIARTERLRLIGWDDRIRRQEHIDFFTRAHGVLTTVLDPRLRCLHAKSPFDRHYMGYRLDYQLDMELLARRYPGIESRPDFRAESVALERARGEACRS